MSICELAYSFVLFTGSSYYRPTTVPGTEKKIRLRFPCITIVHIIIHRKLLTMFNGDFSANKSPDKIARLIITLLYFALHVNTATPIKTVSEILSFLTSVHVDRGSQRASDRFQTSPLHGL